MSLRRSVLALIPCTNLVATCQGGRDIFQTPVQ